MTARHEIPIGDETVVAIHHGTDGDDWLVFCHGFRSDKSGSYESRCRRAVREGYNGVRFDFRGCGESSRSFGEQTLSTRIEDLEAVIEYFDPTVAVLFGSSFGGKVALHAGATDERVEAIATRAPVTYNRAFEKYRDGTERSPPTEGGDQRADITPDFFTDLDTYSFEDLSSTVDVPVAIFHGRVDESVPVADSVEAAGALGSDTMLQLYADEGHRFSRSGEARMRDQLFGWLDNTRGR